MTSLFPEPSSERPRLSPWLLGLGGIAIFLVGGILGAILVTTITLYRTPVAPIEITPVAAVQPTTAAPAVLPTPPPTTAQPTPTRRSTGPSVGQYAPALRLLDLAGAEHPLYIYRGKIVLINFWASWCPPCRQEWPELIRFAEQADTSEVVFLSVNVQESLQVIQDFVGEQELPFPVLLDSTGETSDLYRVTALPTTFLLDREGVVLQVVPGDLTSAALQRLVGNVLEGPD